MSANHLDADVTALTAAKSGLAVAVWDLDEGAARRTEDEIRGNGGVALAVTVDVGSDAAVARAWDATAPPGPCRYLVNNAGPASSSEAPFEKNVALALGSVDRVTSTWRERHGEQASSVVNVSSISGNFHAGGHTASYPAAKAGIAGYTRHLAVTLRGKPRVNAVAPGFTLTPRTLPYLQDESMRKRLERIPTGRAGYPEEIAAAVCFLLSPAAAYVNGVLLPADGGWIHT